MTTDPRPPVELPTEVSVINVGLPLFADALHEQGVPVQPVDWRIPAGGDLELVAALEELYGPRSDAIETANAEVVRRLDQGVPLLVRLCFPACRSGRCCTAARPSTGPRRATRFDARCGLRRWPRAGPPTYKQRAGCSPRVRSSSNRHIDTTPWFRWRAPSARPRIRPGKPRTGRYRLVRA